MPPKQKRVTVAEILQMAKEKRLNPPLTADELRTLLALGSTESVGTELDVLKISRQEAKKAAAGTAKKEKVNTMTFDKVLKCVDKVNKDVDPAGPKLVLTSDEMKTALAYNGEEETTSNLKLLKMSRKEAAQNKKTQLLPIPDLPSNMTVATTGDFKRIPYPDMLGEMGVTEEKVGGAIDSNGQKSVSVSKLEAAHLAQLIFDNKLCNAYRPLPDFSSISSVRADKSAIQIMNTTTFRDQLFIQAPQESVQMSQYSSAHSDEAHSQKSLAVSVSVKASWVMFSTDVGGGHSSSSSNSTKGSACHSIAQIKFPAVELGGFTAAAQTEAAAAPADPPVTPFNPNPGDSLEDYTEKLKARVATLQGPALPEPSLDPADSNPLFPNPDVDDETRTLLSDNGFKSVAATLTVTDDDLKEIGVTVGQRRAVLGFIAAYAAAKRLHQERADAAATKFYSQQKPVSYFDDAIGHLGLTADQTTELATKYFTNIRNGAHRREGDKHGDYEPFFARVEQLRHQNKRGPFVVNPDLLAEATELVSRLPTTEEAFRGRGRMLPAKAGCSRESVRAFFDRWGLVLPSRFVLGQMASYSSTVKIDSKTDQDAAQSEADVSASFAFAAVNASVKEGSGSGTQDSTRTSSLQSTVVSGAAPAMITVDKSYQLGDHRHEPAAWRCIEVHAGTPVLQLLPQEQQHLIVKNLRWILESESEPSPNAGTYRIECKISTTRVMDVTDSETTAGTQVQLFERVSDPETLNLAQRFLVQVLKGDQINQFVFSPYCALKMAVGGDGKLASRTSASAAAGDFPKAIRFKLTPEPGSTGYFNVESVANPGKYWCFDSDKNNTHLTVTDTGAPPGVDITSIEQRKFLFKFVRLSSN